MSSFKLEKQRRANAREVGLREKLQTSYDEQEVLVQQQFIWQQRIEALQQQQQHLAWQKQELEQQQKPFTEVRSK